jgi:hypothetical protein
VKDYAAKLIPPLRQSGGLDAADPFLTGRDFDMVVKAKLQTAIPVPSGLKSRLLALKRVAPKIECSDRENCLPCRPNERQFKRF